MVQVKPMSKVHAAVSLVDAGSSGAIKDEKATFSFIYGIGKDGLTPFECLLEGCQQGDVTQTEVNSQAMGEFFGVLLRQIQPCIEGKIVPLDLRFSVEVLKVEEVENREVVAALAGATGGCGSGGSCGCGCS